VKVAGAFQLLFQEQCSQADIAYVPAVLVCARSRIVDERKTTKSSKKDDKAPKPADDRAGRLCEVLIAHD